MVSQSCDVMFAGKLEQDPFISQTKMTFGHVKWNFNGAIMLMFRETTGMLTAPASRVASFCHDDNCLNLRNHARFCPVCEGTFGPLKTHFKRIMLLWEAVKLLT